MYVSSSKPKQWKRQFRHKAFNCVCIQKKRSVYRKTEVYTEKTQNGSCSSLYGGMMHMCTRVLKAD